MKKVLALLLVLMMTLSFALVSCDEKDDSDDTQKNPQTTGTASDTEADTAADTENDDTQKNTEDTKKPDKNTDGTLVGEWVWEIDMLDMLEKQLAAQLDTTEAVKLEIDSFTVSLIMSLDDKGTCVMSVDKDALEAELDDDFIDAIVDYGYRITIKTLEAQIDAGEVTGTAEENIEAAEAQLGMSMKDYLRSLYAELLTAENFISSMNVSESTENYEVDGDKLTFSDVEFTFEVDGDELTLNYDGDDAPEFMSFPATLTRK